MPVSVESRLQSAARELQHNGGAVHSKGDAPDAVASLHEVLKNLPADIRYSVTELDLDANRLSLQGEVRSHADADSLALSLRQSSFFLIDDPQTQQGTKGSVQFTIGGSLRGQLNSAGREP